MIPEPLAPTTPETKACVRCQVQINAASGYCTLCGTVQRRRRRGGRWLLAAVAALVIGGIAALVAVLGGASSASGEPHLRLYKSSALSALVPDGWSGGPVAVQPGVSRLVFADPVETRRRLIVTAEYTVTLSAVRRARRVRALATTNGDYHQQFFGRIRFPGGRPAWLVSYDSDGSSRAVFVYSACVPSVAMTVELRVVRRPDLRGSLEQIPASAGPACQRGPGPTAPPQGPAAVPRPGRPGSGAAPR